MKLPRIPTVITDKNGKVTTVHKKDGVASKPSSTLAGIKPSLNGSKGSSAKTAHEHSLTIDWQASSWGNKAVPTDSGTFLHRAGLTRQVQEHTRHTRAGKQSIATWELYEFLRNGITPSEGAMLHVLGIGADQLATNQQLQQALPGDLARIVKKDRNEIVSITASVDVLQDMGFNPRKAASIIGNGLNDEHLAKSVLEPKQLADLFDRFKYQHSIDADKGTTSSNTMDAVIDGRLPFELVAKGKSITRPVMTMVLDVMHPEHKKYEVLNLHQKEYLKSDTRNVVQLATLMSKRRVRRVNDVPAIVEALETFGYDNCDKYDPVLMTARLKDGTYVGPDGAQMVREFLTSFAVSNPDFNITENYAGRSIEGIMYPANSYSNGRVIDYRDIVEARRIGVPNDMLGKMFSENLNSEQVLAVINGETVGAIAEGWL